MMLDIALMATVAVLVALACLGELFVRMVTPTRSRSGRRDDVLGAMARVEATISRNGGALPSRAPRSAPRGSSLRPPNGSGPPP